MDWLLALDTAALRLVHRGLKNTLFDWLMPVFSGHPLFFPLVVLVAGLLLWKGGTRGRLCVLMLLLILPLGDGLVCNTIKHTVGRLRPYAVMEWVQPLVGGRGHGSGSMPSAHAANWFAATMVCWFYYRRSWRFMLPLAALVAFSRVYNGVHYPSDVLVGATLGAGYAVAGLWALNTVWGSAGRRWFPLWWVRLPSLLPPFVATQASLGTSPTSGGSDRQAQDRRPPPTGTLSAAAGTRAEITSEQHWLHAGYFLIAVLLVVRLAYIGSNIIQLAEDEAYQWVWSKHLALSYYSKPPLIAYTQWLGTTLWGDTPFGVRFFSPVIGAGLGLLLLRFMAREVGARAGFFLLVIVVTTPLLAVGSTLMTIDPLSVLFWTLAMLAGWRAVQPEGQTRQWVWVGLWTGLGFLSKYTALFQWLCWAVFFLLWPPARVHLRRPGPYVALLVNVLCMLPVVVWNWQHGWVTAKHVADDASLGHPWHFTLRYLGEFLGAEFGLWNPYWFVATLLAVAGMWRMRQVNPRLLYLFSMGAPLFGCYLLFTLYARAQPNWIAPSILPLFCLMVAYWHERWPTVGPWARRSLVGGIVLGLLILVPLHDTRLMTRATGLALPPQFDPLRRVRGWREAAQLAGAARRQLLQEGKPVILIGSNYGITGLMTFYLPEARAVVRDNPLVYCLAAPRPRNQFHLWPGYTDFKGISAVFVQPRRPQREAARLFQRADPAAWQRLLPEAQPPPEALARQFASVSNLGVFAVPTNGWPQQWVQLYACRDLQ